MSKAIGRPRVLILGASVLQLPAIEKAKKRGYDVGVVDQDPEAPGAILADRFYEVSTIDIAGIVDVARDFEPSGIITIGTDMPMRALCAAAEELGLTAPSQSAIYSATDKGSMAIAFAEHGVATPWTLILENESRAWQAPSKLDQHLPIIVKPADSSGSRGVTLVHSMDEFPRAVSRALDFSASDRVLVQEFMRGPEVSVEGFRFGGETSIVAITDKITTGAPHFVELGHSQPSQLGASTQREIRDVVESAVRALALEDCALHAELIITSNGPKMVEIGARLGGDFITSHLVPLSTGVDMIDALIDIALGRRPQVEPMFERGSAVRFLGSAGDPDRLEQVLALPNVELAMVTPSAGNVVVQSSTDRVGHVVTAGATAMAAVATATRAIGMLLVEEPKFV